ncbi:hypothetical protein [Pseudoduganella violaceinigra]|uniref:hypothetical protein n=1 Tax=Pseudoduganella violaceinigra TaxID=246602 RepID=UPI000407821E|nr:hypothetical protein [Pseudoduganella violaceinigra]
MQALRNFEAIFIAAIGLACAANFVYDRSTSETPARPAVAVAVAAPAAQAVPLVVVAAQRMSQEEKQASLAAERKASIPGNI